MVAESRWTEADEAKWREVWVDSPGGLSSRRLHVETEIMRDIMETLHEPGRARLVPPSVRLEAQGKALQRRIEAVKHVKSVNGDPAWEYDPDHLDLNDNTVGALLGPGTFHLFLAEEVLRILCPGIPVTNENAPRLEQALGIDGRTAAKEYAKQLGTSVFPLGF